MLPGVVYGMNENVMVTVNPKELQRILLDHGRNALIDLNIQGEQSAQRHVILKELQMHPVRPGWIHVDFLEIDLTKTTRVSVPVRLEGQSPGEKEGGLVNHVTQEIEVECLPKDIPHAFEVDMSRLELGQSIHVSDLKAPPNVEILNDPEDTVVAVNIERMEEAPAAEEAEGVEAAAEAPEAAQEDKEETAKEEE